MRGLKLGLGIFAAVLFTLALGGLAYAFHSGGVAECEGCHSMHSPKEGGSFLLVGTDQSSTCLTCHEHANDTGPSSYHISTPLAEVQGAGLAPKQRTPGGDFGWLHKTYTFSTETEEGFRHGHNIVAVDFNYAADPSNTLAPGGTFPASQLSCTTCHDPHGQWRRIQNGTLVNTGQPIKASGSYNTASSEPTATEAVGVYRLLAGAGYVVSGASFPGVPAAKAPSTYNQSEGTNQVRVAYGAPTTAGHTTWGNWCATCHPGMHSNGNYVHPVDQSLGSTIAQNYGKYLKSGDLTGVASSSYLSLVPFATTTNDYTVLSGLASNTGAPASLAGPASSDKVMCLSCHRAHASGTLHALRFDIGYEFMTVAGNYLGSDNGAMTSSRAPLQHRGRTMAEWQAFYYDRPASMWATYQRVLCNKCHAKD